MEIHRKRLVKVFPHLAEEIDQGQNTVSIDSYREDSVDAGSNGIGGYSNYDPTVLDFIRRCDTEEQAKEIIDFMEKRGEISRDYAEDLRLRISKEGLRSIGKKKNPGFYDDIGPRP